MRGRSGMFASQLGHVWGWISLPVPPLSLWGTEPREGRESMRGHTAGPGVVTGPGAGPGRCVPTRPWAGGSRLSHFVNVSHTPRPCPPATFWAKLTC